MSSFVEEPAPVEPAPEGSAPDEQGAAPPMDLTKYKTKLCRNFSQKGVCNFGNTCMFAHGKFDLQGSPAAPHAKFEGSHHDPSKYKTRLCRHYASTGTCPFMERCGFAHGQMELNQGHGMPMPQPMGYVEYFPPEMKRPPVMELAKTRLCKHFSAQGSCPYESRCMFAHGQAEVRPRDAIPMPMSMPHPRGPVVMPPVPQPQPAWAWTPQQPYFPS